MKTLIERASTGSGPTHGRHARRGYHRHDCDGAPPNGGARSVQQSHQDSGRSSRARFLQVRHDLAPKDADRRSARLAEINNTRDRRTVVLSRSESTIATKSNATAG